MRLFSYLCIPLFILMPFGRSAAQSPSDYGIKSKKAMKYYIWGTEQQKYRDYSRALEYFHEALLLEPEFGHAHFSSGICYYVMQEYTKAEEHFTKAEKYMMPPPELLYYYVAEIAFNQDQFEKARDNYKKFLDLNVRTAMNITQTAKRNYEKSKFAAKAAAHPISFNPRNLGENINTAFPEYLPQLTADESTIFFTTRRPGNIGGYSREYRDYTEDFYYSVLENGEWQPAVNLGAPINTEMNEGAASFTPDGQYVYFVSCSRPGGYGDCDIYVSKLDGDKWLPPKNLGPLINTPGWESQPCISNDGKTLFFASTRDGGLGGADIWYSQKVNGHWTAAKNLGEPVNTPGTESSPFLHADGSTLYFSSNTHPGFGELDLFMSRRTEEGWSEPMNLGYPLNTSANEGNIFINSSGDQGYFQSTRDDGLGKGDLYVFELDEKIRPNFTTYVRGIVHEKGSDKRLHANVTFINLETGDTIRAVESNKATGKFMLTLPINQDYAAYVETEGYLFASRNFTLRGLSEDKNNFYDLDIALQPIEAGAVIVLNNIFYETNKFELLQSSKTELQQIISFMKAHPKVRIEIAGHTDDVGSTSDNQVLSERRAGAVRQYLVKRGVPEGQIVAKGYGESTPVADNGTPEGRALNRRTEFRVLEVQK